MYYGNNLKSSHNHWFDWVLEGQEKEMLYYQIRQLVEDMLEEKLPQLFKQYMEGQSIDVSTIINGNSGSISGIKEDIQQLVYEKVREALR